VKDELDDTIKELIAKSLAGETTVAEEQQLTGWITDSPENEQQFRQFQKVLMLGDNHFTSARKNNNLDIDIDAEWNRFTDTIANKNKTRVLESDSGSSRWWRIAAAILILAISGVVVNYFINKNNNLQFETAQTTKVIKLPDGSTVTLNYNSKFAYDEDFGKENRTLTFTGEAFFDVAPDPKKPFIIQLKSGVVEVVGTSFNVRAYDSLEKTEVIVKTGIVKLSIAGSQKEIKLAAGEKGFFEKGNQELKSVINEDVNYLSWNTKEIIFTENDLQTVIETINKTYNTNIVLATDIADTCVVTVKFDRQTLEAVLHVLENTLNLTYRKNGNQIEITSAGC
jgi:ferric-dicitrate binding protein FerR (iron transport regulator)